MLYLKEKSQYKWGLVNHALCEAIKELLKVIGQHNHFLFKTFFASLIK